MPRQKVIDLTQSAHGGVWAAGPRDTSPANTLRRGTGLHPTRERVLRSRNGTTVEDTIAAAHTLGKFKGTRWQAAGTVLYKNAVSTVTGLDGTRLTLQASIPRTGTTIEDYYFIAGGGSASKYKETGGLVQNWGITPETAMGVQGTAASAAAILTKVIDDLETTAGMVFDDTDAEVGSEFGTIEGQNGTAITVVVPGDDGITWKLTKDVTVDLSEFADPSEPSSDEDFIQLWVQLTPAGFRVFESGSIDLSFSIGATTYTDAYTFRILPGFNRDEAGTEDITDTPDSLSNADRLDLLRTLSRTTIPASSIWVDIKIAKALFTRIGTGAYTWADVQSFRFQFNKARGLSGGDNDKVYFDYLRMSGGGGGKQGDYKYRFTSLNSLTGNRSDPWFDTTIAAGDYFTVTVTDVNRQTINITGLPATLTDAQADFIEIWRTVGNGVRYFKAGEVAEGVTTFADNVADFIGLDTSANAAVLEALELPLDNAEPDDEFEDFIIDRATAFWTTSKTDERGRLYYSPLGRPESKKGFIDVTNDDDPLQRIVIVAGLRVVFSIAKVFRIDGDDPYVAREIPGVPGVLAANARTVTATTIGIMYQAQDGIRLISGVQSRLVGFDALGPLFRGEALENLTAFEGVVATFARNEYIISNGTQCIAYDVTQGTWRDLGFADITALYYEHDTDTAVAGRTSNTQLIEVEGTLNDAGSNIAVAWETAALTLQDRLWVIEDVYFDLDTGGAALTPTLVAKNGNVTMATITQSGRAVVGRELNRLFHVAGARLTGNGSARMSWYGVEYQVRELVLGINISVAGQVGRDMRVTVSGYSNNLGTSIIFDVQPVLRALDQLNTVYFVERLAVEADTNSTNITPSITTENATITLTAVNTSARDTVEENVERVGPIQTVTLSGDFTADVQIFGIEMVVRPVVLGVRIGQQRFEIAGHIEDADTSIVFDLDPENKLLDALTFIPLIERLSFDVDTKNNANANITAKILAHDANTITLSPAFGTAARESVNFDVNRIVKVRGIQLDASFDTEAIAIYGVELVVRPLELTVRVLSANLEEQIGGNTTTSAPAAIV